MMVIQSFIHEAINSFSTKEAFLKEFFNNLEDTFTECIAVSVENFEPQLVCYPSPKDKSQSMIDNHIIDHGLKNTTNLRIVTTHKITKQSVITGRRLW